MFSNESKTQHLAKPGNHGELLINSEEKVSETVNYLGSMGETILRSILPLLSTSRGRLYETYVGLEFDYEQTNETPYISLQHSSWSVV